MNHFYGEILTVHPAQPDGTVYCNAVSKDKASEGVAVQLASDKQGLFAGETLKEGDVLNMTTEKLFDNNGVAVLSVTKIKKRYQGKPKGKDNSGMLIGHAVNCAAAWGASAEQLEGVAKQFHTLTQKVKKVYAEQEGISVDDYNTGATVGNAVKLAAHYAAGQDMRIVESYTMALLGKTFKKIKEYIERG